jgi:hypothetical protein
MEAPMKKSKDDSEETKRVKFNVGGQVYEISRDIVMRHHETMLARIASETWQKDPTATIFINGDGERFRYVLDYLRTGSILLPLTVSKPAILKDLEYYGFEDVNPKDIDGWDNASAEAAIHIGKKGAKKDEVVEEIDAKIKFLKVENDAIIEALKLEKACVLVAHKCFVLCCNSPPTIKDNMMIINYGTIDRELRRAFYTSFDEELFNKHLAQYGFYLIKHTGHPAYMVSLGLLSDKDKSG